MRALPDDLRSLELVEGRIVVLGDNVPPGICRDDSLAHPTLTFEPRLTLPEGMLYDIRFPARRTCLDRFGFPHTSVIYFTYFSTPMKSLHLIVSFLVCAVVVSAQSVQPSATARYSAGRVFRALARPWSYLLDESNGSAALMGNPATLADQNKPDWNIGVSADVSRIKETRSYPFYDAFDGVLGYNNYALNDHVYSKVDGGAAYRMKQEQLESMDRLGGNVFSLSV